MPSLTFCRNGNVEFIGSVLPEKKERNRGKEVTVRKAARAIAAVAVGLVVVSTLVSCASTPKTTSGFLGTYASDLQPGPKGGVNERWLKPGVDFAKYKKVMLDHVVFYFADDSENKAIDTSELGKMAEQCDLAIVNVLKDSHPVVAEPGPDVVRIRFAITDLKQSRPVLSGVTSVLPIGLAISLVKKGATGSWTGSGITKADVMAMDSMTDDVIAVARDDYSAKFMERFSKWGSVEEAFKYWGERLKQFMDEAEGKKQ
jgi:hypothetical protein